LQDQLYRIEDALGTTPSDGGADTHSDGSHTHAPSRLEVNEKPSSNAATEKKLEYLAGCIESETAIAPDKSSMIPRSVLRETVKEEYGFRKDTAKRYVEQLVEYFDLREHPNPKFDQLVTETRFRELVEKELEGEE
jgi:hypothetical protein